MKKRIIIIGGGGHAKVVIDAIKNAGRFAVCGIVDPGLRKGDTVSGVKVLGGDKELTAIYARGVRSAFIGVGSIGDCGVRKNIRERLKKAGFKSPSVIHPKAIVASDVEIGDGTFIAPGVVINPGAVIGENAIINTSSSIDHDCVVGDFVHVAPGVTVSGGVEIGDDTHIGTGASVTQYVKIGKRCVIGAGVLVRKDLPDGSRFFGKNSSEEI